MPRDRRPDKTPSNAAIVEASKLQTINAFEENRMMRILIHNEIYSLLDNYQCFQLQETLKLTLRSNDRMCLEHLYYGFSNFQAFYLHSKLLQS